jgi:capsular polysaccharide biosynthesis protein
LQLLVLQKNLDIDAYRAAKSSEYAAENLERIIYTPNFMDRVIKGAKTVKDDFGTDPEARSSNWAKTVQASKVSDTGILKVAVLTKNQKEGQELIKAINNELINNGEKLHGNPNMYLKNIGGPTFFVKPVSPNVPLNTLGAAVLGLFLGIALVFLKGEKVDSWMYQKEKKAEIFPNNYGYDFSKKTSKIETPPSLPFFNLEELAESEAKLRARFWQNFG